MQRGLLIRQRTDGARTNSGVSYSCNRSLHVCGALLPVYSVLLYVYGVLLHVIRGSVKKPNTIAPGFIDTPMSVDCNGRNELHTEWSGGYWKIWEVGNRSYITCPVKAQ